mmetsp:Transcript_9096/g.14799  ORF Transcript_9096/g.14799 Transcript_9096/m.14799 type:complete len:126 (+) Transcript_9096:807-1184(+)
MEMKSMYRKLGKSAELLMISEADVVGMTVVVAEVDTMTAEVDTMIAEVGMMTAVVDMMIAVVGMIVDMMTAVVDTMIAEMTDAITTIAVMMTVDAPRLVREDPDPVLKEDAVDQNMRASKTHKRE